MLGLDALARELAQFLCTVPRASQRDARHGHALALLEDLLWAAKAESFSLPRPKNERARKLADHLTSRPEDGRALEIVAAEIGGASLRTFERLFVDETGLSLAAWRRQSCMLASVSLLAEGKSIGEVARAVGYDSAAAFSTAFKQCFGAVAVELRDELKAGNSSMVRGVLGFVIGVVLWMPAFFLLVFLVALGWPEYASHGRVWFETSVFTFDAPMAVVNIDRLGVGRDVRGLGRGCGGPEARASLGAFRGARPVPRFLHLYLYWPNFPWWYNVAVAGLAAPAVLVGSKLARLSARRTSL